MTIGRNFILPLALATLFFAGAVSAQTAAPGAQPARAGAEEAEEAEPRPSPRWYRRKFIPTAPSRFVSVHRRPLKCNLSAKFCKAKVRRR